MSYTRWCAITLGVWATFETSLVEVLLEHLWGNFSANRSLTTKEESPLAGKLNWIGKNRGPLYFLKDSLNNSLLQWVTNILPFCAFLLCSCPVEQPCHCPDPWDTEKINNKSLDPLASTKIFFTCCTILVCYLCPDCVRSSGLMIKCWPSSHATQKYMIASSVYREINN